MIKARSIAYAVKYFSKYFPATVMLTLFCLTSCSSTEPEPPAEAVEVKSKTASTVDAPEAELLYAAKRLYAAGLYSVASENFESLRSGYPQGPYAEFAEIKIADAHFEMREYDLAIQSFEAFIKDRPASSTLPYAMLRAGRSHQLSFKGLGRDTAPLKKAVEWYDALILTYPDSIYATTAKTFRAEAIDQLAESDLMIASFYRKMDDIKAADAREIQYRQDWSPIIASLQPRVLAMSRGQGAIASSTSQPVSIEVITPIVLQVTRGKTSQAPNIIHANSSKSGVGVDRSDPAATSGGGLFDFSRWRIQNVQCTTQGGNKLFIVLNQNFTDQQFLDTHREITVSDGVLELALPSTAGREETRDCFASDDLTITPDGHVSLKAPNGIKARVMTLDYPPRLAVLFAN